MLSALTIYFLKDLTPQFGKWKHKQVKESILTPIPSPSKKSDKTTGHIEGKKTQYLNYNRN